MAAQRSVFGPGAPPPSGMRFYAVDCHLRTVPIGLILSENVKEAYLSNNRGIRELPVQLNNAPLLRNLRELFLSNCGLFEITSAFLEALSRHGVIEELHLPGNSISNLPREIGLSGLARSLRVLNIADNCLTHIPPSITRLRLTYTSPNGRLVVRGNEHSIKFPPAHVLHAGGKATMKFLEHFFRPKFVDAAILDDFDDGSDFHGLGSSSLLSYLGALSVSAEGADARLVFRTTLTALDLPVHKALVCVRCPQAIVAFDDQSIVEVDCRSDSLSCVTSAAKALLNYLYTGDPLLGLEKLSVEEIDLLLDFGKQLGASLELEDICASLREGKPFDEDKAREQVGFDLCLLLPLQREPAAVDDNNDASSMISTPRLELLRRKQSEVGLDITLRCLGPETASDLEVLAERPFLRAHTFLLRRVAYFEALLSGKWADKKGEMEWNVGIDVARAILEFIYSDNPASSCQSDLAVEVLEACCQFSGLGRLQRWVEQYLADNLEDETVAPLLSLADTWGAMMLSSLCTMHMAFSLTQTVAPERFEEQFPGWSNLSPEQQGLVMSTRNRFGKKKLP